MKVRLIQVQSKENSLRTTFTILRLIITNCIIQIDVTVVEVLVRR